MFARSSSWSVRALANALFGEMGAKTTSVFARVVAVACAVRRVKSAGYEEGGRGFRKDEDLQATYRLCDTDT